MRRKSLSILISAIVVVSQVSMVTAANAATTGEPVVKAISSNSAQSSVSSVDDIIKSISPDIIVDKKYSGDNGKKVNGIATYNNVAAAIASVRNDNSQEKMIFIKNGIYKEKLTISAPNVALVGESAERTILTYDDAAGTIKRTADGGDGKATYGTTGSASITVKESAHDFKAANLTISNSFDEKANPKISGQAVALKNEADKSVFVNCRFLGNQDTLYANKNKQYYYNCFIEGDVDFIFGGAQAVFKGCEIKSLDRSGITPKGFVAAPSTLQSDKYGYLMLDCKLTSNITEKGSVYLGRPWHPTSQTNPMISNVVYKHCYLGAHITADGWSKMSKNEPKDNDMYEADNYGPGANTTNVNRRQLTKEKADIYTVENILNKWDPSGTANKLASYKEKKDDFNTSEAYDKYMDNTTTVDTSNLAAK